MSVMVVGKVVVACIYTFKLMLPRTLEDVDSIGGLLACEYNNVSSPLPFLIIHTTNSFHVHSNLPSFAPTLCYQVPLHDDNYT